MNVTNKTTSLIASILVLGSLTSALSGAIATPAVAAFATTDCNNTTVTFTSANKESYSYGGCQHYAGNDTGEGGTLSYNLNTKDIFGDPSWQWELAAKSDIETPSGFSANEGATSGSWWLKDNYQIRGPFVVSFKAGDFYSVYFFNNPNEAITSGVFNTAGVAANGASAQSAPLVSASLFAVKGLSSVGPQVGPNESVALRRSPGVLPSVGGSDGNSILINRVSDGKNADISLDASEKPALATDSPVGGGEAVAAVQVVAGGDDDLVGTGGDDLVGRGEPIGATQLVGLIQPVDVPEPGTLAGLALVGVALGLLRRK